MPVAWGLPVTKADTGWWHFSSRHSGIVNFAMCDGSVRSIPVGFANSSNTPFNYAGGIMDGQVYDPTTLGL